MQFILLLLSFLLLSSRAASSGNVVVDFDGEELKPGQLYYAVSWLWGAGAGGLKLVPLNASCPLYVAKAGSFDELGQPLALFPEDGKEGTIREGNTLYIMFTLPTNCKESTVWRYDIRNNLVTTGGTSSSSFGPHDSRFALYKHEVIDRTYLIHPCPCSSGDLPGCRKGCSGPLGVGDVNGKSLLRADSFFHAVIFKKVKGGKGPMVRSAAMHAYA